MSELKTCPFCGGDAEKYRHDYYELYYVRCMKCCARTDEEVWNTRTPPKEQP